MKRLSKQKKDSVLTPPSFSIDPIDPKNDAAYYDYLDALDWEKADMESNRGRIYEQEAGRGPRRDITSRNAPGYHDFDGKEYMHVPKILNSGRNFWGFTGSRAGLSPMTKRMLKSISSLNQGGVKHVVGGYRGGKMSKAMDMKTHTPKMPSTKRDIRNTDKYFN
jgi:hypothetical protein